MYVDTPSRCSPVRITLEYLKRDAFFAQTLGQSKTSDPSTNNQNMWILGAHNFSGKQMSRPRKAQLMKVTEECWVLIVEERSPGDNL